MGPIIHLTTTPRCRLREAAADDRHDIEDVIAVLEDLADLMRLLGPPRPAADAARDMLAKAELPPGGAAEFARTRVIEDARTGALLGVLEYYCGYPSPDSLYIGSLFLLQQHHRRGYGAEVEAALARLARDAGYRSLYAGVGLRNWPALRFWTARGYREVTKIAGAAHHAPGSFAVIELRRTLARGTGPDPG